MQEEIFIKPDAKGKNNPAITVNGKQIRFNANAVNLLELRDKVNVSLVKVSETENRLMFRTNVSGQPALALGGAKMKYRDLNSESAVKAARLGNGSYPIEGDEQTGFYVVCDPNAPAIDTITKRIANPRKEKAVPVAGAAQEIAKKKAEKEKAGK